MGDADVAQYNALASVFSDCKYIHLMCYYHVIAKMVDRLKGLSNELSSTCFRTPPGFATTKNPVEQFNRVLKRDYTAHRLLETGELLQQLASCCSNRSIDVRPFSESPGTSKELLSRVKALRGKQLLREFVLPRMSADFLLVDSSNDVFHVLYTPPNRIYNTTSNSAHEAIQVSAQVGANTARMEIAN
ncbi:hypothetical protein PPTG_20041 [Phytophthora nicotianae INRA-310]|uniref:MULE transposase domain-containing protein n=1 Tax=Phytophthora nicotianae (strain INRA-310) TaxID=761204 RepID=W2P9V3_PHYN3|nr:hypothetical protein PPTG_20041 [Phytophthora nicotianae INRA-310]ETM97797.1 hypothetical protein PPTG_20041 [Phytophthora nicotianae INRA-310]